MRKIFNLFAVVVMAALVVACGKKDAEKDFQLKIIQKDVSFVFRTNLKSFKAKSLNSERINRILNGIPQYQMAKGMIPIDFSNSGFDTDKSVYVYGNPDAQFRKGYVAMSIAVKDFEAIKTMMGKLKALISVKEEKGTYSGKFEDLVGFRVDKKVAFIVLKSEGEKQPVEELINNLLGTKKGNSLAASNEKFRTHITQDKDLLYWSSMESTLNTLPRYERQLLEDLVLANLKIDFSDCYAYASVNFENGKIVANTKYDINDNLKQLFNKFVLNKGVSDELVSKLPGKKPIMVSSVNINLKGIQEWLLSLEKTKHFKEMFEKETGMNLVDLFGAVNGEFAFTLTGEVEKEVTKDYYGEPMTMKRKGPEFGAVAQVKNMGVASQFLTFISKQAGDEFTRDDDCFIDENQLVHVCRKGDYLIAVGGDAYRTQLEKGKFESEIDPVLRKEMTTSPIYYRIDFNQMQSLMRPRDAKMFDKFMVLEYIEAKVKDLDNLESEGVLYMKNKKENSLKVILDMIENEAIPMAKQQLGI